MTVKDLAGLVWFVHHRLSMLGQELTEILPKNKKNHDLGNGYCAENHELHYKTRLGSWCFQMTNRMPYCFIKKK